MGLELTIARDRLPGLDAPAVERWLANAVPRLVAPLRFARIGRGNSNLTFAIEDAAGGTAVLRRPPLATRVASAHDVVREHRVLSALAGSRAPVPSPLALCEDTSITGAPFFVMERIEGLVVDDAAAAERLDLAARRSLGPALGRTLADLHGVEPAAVGLADLGPTSSLAARQLKRFESQWVHAAIEDDRVPALAARLHAALPAQPTATIVHGDFGLRNLIVGPDGDVRAILDWELCTLGDPLADLGTLLTYWAEGPDDDPAGGTVVNLLPGFGGRDEVVAAYARASGRDVSDLPYYLTLAYWRMAVILEGVRRRRLADPANASVGPPQLEARVRRLIELAWSSADDAGL